MPLALAVWLSVPTSITWAINPGFQGTLSRTLHRLQSKPTAPLAQPGIFPTISSFALDKTPILLPTGLEGRQNLLLLSWARNQGSQLDSWRAVSQALQHTRMDFRVYRMPVNAPENSLFRWWDNASFRAAETDPELLHWSVPLYTDKAALHEAIALGNDEGAVVALLVDRSGHILWKAQGASTDVTRNSLVAAAGPTQP